MPLPIITIVGRPNVGKSTLFNRLVGERIAIVSDIAGTTRDRVSGDARWNDERFVLVDTAGIEAEDEVDPQSVTGLGATEALLSEVQAQTSTALEDADVLIFMVDASQGITPKDIMTRKAFLNAITVVIALGGSTNAVLHLLAMAKAIGTKLELGDFTKVGNKVPVLADLRPSGTYMMTDLIQAGGIQPLMKMLLGAGLLHGECITVTGKTLAANLKNVTPYSAKQKIIRPLDDPIKKDSHLVILYGNLAPEGAVAKITGKEGLLFEGKAKVFSSEEKALDAILKGTIKKGHVVVIRYEGPRGGPGMREMLAPTSAIVGKGLGRDVALITDGRFSGGSHGFVIGHITPEAAEGGPLAIVKNGDRITIDAKKKQITLHVQSSIIKQRLKGWKAPKPQYVAGVLAKYAAQVGPASGGAVTDIIE